MNFKITVLVVFLMVFQHVIFTLPLNNVNNNDEKVHPNFDDKTMSSVKNAEMIAPTLSDGSAMPLEGDSSSNSTNMNTPYNFGDDYKFDDLFNTGESEASTLLPKVTY